MNFREALLEVYREDMFPVRKNGIKYELDNTQLRFKSMKEKVCSSSQFYCIVLPFFVGYFSTRHPSI